MTNHAHDWIPAKDRGPAVYQCSSCPAFGYKNMATGAIKEYAKSTHAAYEQHRKIEAAWERDRIRDSTDFERHQYLDEEREG